MFLTNQNIFFIHQLILHRKFGHENILQFHGITMMETGMIKEFHAALCSASY